jgi:cytochrome c5
LKLLAFGCAAILPILFFSASQKAAPGQAAPTKGAGVAAPDAAMQRALVDQYCVTCHNTRSKTANLMLDQFDFTHLGDHAEVGEKIVRKLRAGMMPPTGMKRPDPAALETFIQSMEKELDRTAHVALPPPGLHRLNRGEYANAIRDVIGLEVDAAKFLPSDDSTRGFDNIAGALKMSPALMEAYLSASGKISRLAIGDVSSATQAVFDVPADTAQNYHVDGMPRGTRGGILIPYQFPADGEYAFTVKAITGYSQGVLGGITGERLDVFVDSARVNSFDWDKEIATTRGKGAATPKVAIKAGLHTVSVTFRVTNDIPGSELNKPFERTMNAPGSIPGFQFYPHVGQVIIEGPYRVTGVTDTASRNKIFVCRPASVREESQCARTIISTLVKHAFRRPSTPADLESLTTFYLEGRKNGGSFDKGIEVALQRILADPEFVYRGEREPVGAGVGRSYRLSDLELASRLSFFLWSSVPDDQLIDLAVQGKLQNQAVLDQQVKRMLADPKSEALIRNFTGQWLSVRSLKTMEPVVNIFPDYDDNLRLAFQTEIELFFDSIVHEDRSVLDLLTADYTFVNERLARHYGIPNLYGPQFRRITLTPDLDMRRGLLGKGALLTVTSQPARTSPVARGKWFLQTFLGVSPPDPPPNVPAIKEQAADSTGNLKTPTMRQRMEAHHSNPTCASCHRIFEPIGLALENFDAVAAWRTQDEGAPIDATGVLVDGTKLDGVASLRNVMVRYSDQFVRVVTEKLLIYGLGRGVEYQDMPLVRSIVHDSAPGKYKFSSIVQGIVRSPAFRMNMKELDSAN